MKIRKHLYQCHLEHKKIKLCWIPSHRGIVGNEKADLLAKESLHLPDPLLLCKCHYSNLYSKFKKLAKEKAAHIFLNQSQIKGARYFKLIDKILSPPWYNSTIPKLTRPVITLISRIRSFHTATHGHLWEKNIVPAPDCPCGHPFQDPNHLFFECPNYRESSKKFVTSVSLIDPLIELDIPKLVFSNNIRIYHKLYSFVTQEKLNL